MKLRQYLTLFMLPSAILFVMKQKWTNQNQIICSEIFSNSYIFKLIEQKNYKGNVKMAVSMWTRIDWSASHLSVTNIKSSYDVKIWKKKDVFYDLRELTNFLWQWRTTWRMLDLSRTCFNSSEGQESCGSLVKNNFVRAFFSEIWCRVWPHKKKRGNF